MFFQMLKLYAEQQVVLVILQKIVLEMDQIAVLMYLNQAQLSAEPALGLVM
jgi:hypothetical protein